MKLVTAHSLVPVTFRDNYITGLQEVPVLVNLEKLDKAFEVVFSYAEKDDKITAGFKPGATDTKRPMTCVKIGEDSFIFKGDLIAFSNCLQDPKMENAAYKWKTLFLDKDDLDLLWAEGEQKMQAAQKQAPTGLKPRQDFSEKRPKF